MTISIKSKQREIETSSMSEKEKTVSRIINSIQLKVMEAAFRRENSVVIMEIEQEDILNTSNVELNREHLSDDIKKVFDYLQMNEFDPKVLVSNNKFLLTANI